MNSPCDDELSARMRAALPICIGVVSEAAVKAALRVAYRRRSPVMLIASRRQVERDSVGGGYVAGWSPERFVRTIRAVDPDGLAIICRDHGGPFQHPAEAQMNVEQAMKSASESFAADIDAGFDVLHIDTSAGRNGEAAPQEAIDRFVELADCVAGHANRRKRPIAVEMGGEFQDEWISKPGDVRALLRTLSTRIRNTATPYPVFVVTQTGTLVDGLENKGLLNVSDEQSRSRSMKLRELQAIVREFDASIKAHNCDYLQRHAWHALGEAGISTNVAPEYATAGTKVLLDLLAATGMTKERETFIDNVVDSGMWKRWTRSDSSDEYKALCAGHYLHDPETADLRARVSRRLQGDSHGSLEEAVTQRIEYLIEWQLAAYRGISGDGREAPDLNGHRRSVVGRGN